MPLFGKSSKNPGEAVKQLKESLMVLEKQHNGESQKKFEKAHDDVRHCPSYFKAFASAHSNISFHVLETREKYWDGVCFSKYIFTISSLLFSCDSDQQSDIVLGEIS